MLLLKVGYFENKYFENTVLYFGNTSLKHLFCYSQNTLSVEFGFVFQRISHIGELK